MKKKIKIPGITEKEIIEVIQNVAKNHRNKAFDYHTEDDIEQEASIIAWSKLSEFVPARGKSKNIKQSLENWLNTVVSRRLKNFYRDKFLVPQKSLKSDKSTTEQSKRTNLMHPLNIEDISDETFKVFDNNYFDKYEFKYIIENLSFEMLDILEAILSGQNIKCYYRNKLLEKIKKLSKENEERP